MDGFINKKYYVECLTADEVYQFMSMCEEAELMLRSGRKPTSFLLHNHKGAVFAYEWGGIGDGVSCWYFEQTDQRPHSDWNLPHVPVQAIKMTAYKTEIPEVLELL